jgi:hypothetical protein
MPNEKHWTLEELDDRAARIVMGWTQDTVTGTFWVNCDMAASSKELWRPTVDLNQAWRCLLMFRHMHSTCIQSLKNGWECGLSRRLFTVDGTYEGRGEWLNFEAPTASLAIVLACLAAKEQA